MPEAASMIELRGVSAGYGDAPVLHDVSLTVAPGEIVAVLGANGAGKSSLLRTIIMHRLRVTAGQVILDGRDVARERTDVIARSGFLLVPEDRGLFPFMSVRDNLSLVLDTIDRSERSALLERVEAMFPVVTARSREMAGNLSGGEQQMLAIARSILLRARCLMLDEPSQALAPKVVVDVFRALEHMRDALGTTLVIVEQNVQSALRVADRAYLLARGSIVYEGSGAALAQQPEMLSAYLGVE